MTHHRNIIEDYLSDKEAEEFAEWAVGEDFRVMDGEDWPVAWNSRHSEYLISGDSAMEIDIPKMIDLWNKQRLQNGR
jgi:hypothetical protein